MIISNFLFSPIHQHLGRACHKFVKISNFLPNYVIVTYKYIT